MLHRGKFDRKSLQDDGLIVRQPEKGYRYSLDAVILAWHADPLSGFRVLDLGTGCGIVSLILGYRFERIKIYGIEIQQPLADLADSNVKENRMADRIKIIRKDLRTLDPGDTEGTVDMVVVNPPFGKIGCARMSPDRSKNAATHEVSATLRDVVKCSERMLKVAGAMTVVYPVQRMPELLDELRRAELEPKWLRMVHPWVCQDANRVIVKAVKKGRKGLSVVPPLFVHETDRSFTPEVKGMLGFRTCSG